MTAPPFDPAVDQNPPGEPPPCPTCQGDGWIIGFWLWSRSGDSA